MSYDIQSFYRIYFRFVGVDNINLDVKKYDDKVIISASNPAAYMEKTYRVNPEKGSFIMVDKGRLMSG